MKEKYKPILVLYLNYSDSKEQEKINQECHQIKEKWGYNVLILPTNDDTSRAEIISVDKATVVEDIQKYIDLKIVKE
jgi:hypothetical protein